MILQTNFLNRGLDIGECFSELKGIDFIDNDNGGYLRADLEVSNLNMTKMRVTVNLFTNSYHIKAQDFLDFMGTNKKEELVGKLFYCKIVKKNTYNTLSNLYLKVDKSNLVFDPREKTIAENNTVARCNLKDIFA